MLIDEYTYFICIAIIIILDTLITCENPYYAHSSSTPTNGCRGGAKFELILC